MNPKLEKLKQNSKFQASLGCSKISRLCLQKERRGIDWQCPQALLPADQSCKHPPPMLPAPSQRLFGVYSLNTSHPSGAWFTKPAHLFINLLSIFPNRGGCRRGESILHSVIHLRSCHLLQPAPCKAPPRALSADEWDSLRQPRHVTRLNH